MASKSGKSEKSLPEKLKTWFRGKPQEPPSFPAQEYAEEFVLKPDLIQELGSESPIQTRLKVLKELTNVVREKPLQDIGVELLWMKTKDLMESSDVTIRHTTLYFYVSLITGQFQKLDIMRANFFRIIEQYCSKENQEPVLLLLNALTAEGKNILHFEEKIGSFLVKFYALISDTEHIRGFLPILLNMLMYNPAYVDADVICGLINLFDKTCRVTKDNKNIEICLKCLFAIMGYCYIPTEALNSFICILCHLVNLEAHAAESWRIMENLMGTHMSHSALYNLCQIMQIEEYRSDIALVRGAVFFLGKSLWGSKHEKSLECYSAMTILPTFISALECSSHHLITYEVTRQLERLILKKGGELRAPGCDCALELVGALMVAVTKHGDEDVQKEIYHHIHNTISHMESLSEEKLYRGSKRKLYDIIDSCAKDRPESSVINLIEYRSNGIYPTKPTWINDLRDLVSKYLMQSEFHENVRMKALEVMLHLVMSNRHMYEVDLLEKIVFPFLRNLDDEQSMKVKLEGLKVLTSICSEFSTAKSMGLLDIYERILSKPLELKDQLSWTEHDRLDIQAAVTGLISIFGIKLFRSPGSFLERIFNILCQHLEDNYKYPNLFSCSGHIRYEIFKLFLGIRANENYFIGVCEDLEDTKVKYSPFVVCRDIESLKSDAETPRSRRPSGNQTLTYLSLTRACKLVISTLTQETDWNVLKIILAKVPTVLQNKAMITKYGKDIHQFVSPLIELTSKNNQYPEKLSNTPTNFSRTEFHKHVYPVLNSLATYSEYLDTMSQRALITALHNGLMSKECTKICIIALTACTLEMKKQMYHLITQLLLNFSKISATKMIAMPMLEFLSTLIRMPDIFASFTDTNYMSVFAIALPYTNPFKFDPYTVSLAHHIIIMWYLKCRLSYRQNFVQFIITGLNSNMMPTLDTGGLGKLMNKSNDDSADRKRSSSLSESNAKLRSRHNTGVTAKPGQKGQDEASEEQAKRVRMNLFHQELTETCVDILARYMFSNSSVQPKRLPTTKFLLQNGNSATWLLNTMLITITTSHCDLNANRSGLCDRCHLICSKCNLSQELEDNAIERKRHQSEFQVQKPSPSRYFPGATAKDEFDLRRQISAEKLSAKESKGDQEEEREEEKLGKTAKVIDDVFKSSQKKIDLCGCWCTGWAEVHTSQSSLFDMEVYVRRPSGDVSWMCRVQNTSLVSDSHMEFPLLSDLSSLMKPSLDIDFQKEKKYQESISGSVEGPLSSELSEQTFSILHQILPDSEKAESTIEKTAVKKVASYSDIEKTSTEHQEESFVESGTSSRQSYDPIMEQKEDEQNQQQQLSKSELMKRRISLQTSGGANERLSSSKGSSPLRSREASGTPPTPGKSGSPFRLLSSDPQRFGIRDRAHTVSGPSPRKVFIEPAVRRGPDFLKSQSSESADRSGTRVERVTGISPQYVFLQLFHDSSFGSMQKGNKHPMLLPATNMMEASIRNLDRIHAYETHKVGVLYIDPNQQDDETLILLNGFGSARYMQFLHGLGPLISLKDADKASTYLGGLDHSDGDGDFTYLWEDDVLQMVFHVATLMPNHENDPRGNKKKRHIGNNFVTIIYNNSGSSYKFGTVKAQFIYACVVIVPLDQGSNKVFIECKPELQEPLGHMKDPRIVSDRNLPILVRQLALHCNLISQIQKSLSSGSNEPYSSNCLERLRQIKRIKDKVLNEEKKVKEVSGNTLYEMKNANDFTKLVLRRKED